jgi:hypothetical protein
MASQIETTSQHVEVSAAGENNRKDQGEKKMNAKEPLFVNFVVSFSISGVLATKIILLVISIFLYGDRKLPPKHV